MNIIKSFILLFMLSLSCKSQVNHLKPEFRNLSWVMDSKSSEVVFTLSKHFGSNSLKNDSVFVTQNKYELYQDSLVLYKLTKDAYKEKNSKAKSTIIGDFIEAKERHSVADWIKIFDKTTREAYTLNKNSTIGENGCIPSTYENLKFFYAKEKNTIKSYNNGRIKVYHDKSGNVYDTINFYLVFHKTIQPIEQNAVYYYVSWLPYTYFYAKPKQVVYPATISKIWETKTGLPYSITEELQLTDERIVKILSLPKIVNDDVLIKKAPIVNREYNISVKCDTCNVKLFDNHIQDNDVINFTYKNITQQITIKKAETIYDVILSQDNSFYISAVSEGRLETCTVDALIDGTNHVFSLVKGEKVLIKLKKEL